MFHLESGPNYRRWKFLVLEKKRVDYVTIYNENIILLYRFHTAENSINSSKMSPPYKSSQNQFYNKVLG